MNEVTLTCGDELIEFDRSSHTQIQGPDGLFHETSCSTIEWDVVTTPVALGQPGTCTVAWSSDSSGGHPISEEYGHWERKTFDAEPGTDDERLAATYSDRRSS